MTKKLLKTEPASLDMCSTGLNWLVNDKGQVVGGHAPGWRDYLDDSYQRLEMRTVNEAYKYNTCMFYRPRGGLGDIICLLPAIESFVAIHYDDFDEFIVYLPELYEFLFKTLLKREKVVYMYVKKDNVLRFEEYRQVFFIWCPAGMHEQATAYIPTRGRVENFADLLQVEPTSPKICLEL